MYLGNRRYDYSKTKRKYHLQALSNNQFNLKDVKVVINQSSFHLLFPMDFRKGKKNEPWAVKTKLGWTLSGPLPKHEIAQLAIAFAASDNDQLSEEVTSWWSVESYATHCNVSGRPQNDKRVTEFLGATTHLSGDKYDVCFL